MRERFQQGTDIQNSSSSPVSPRLFGVSHALFTHVRSSLCFVPLLLFEEPFFTSSATARTHAPPCNENSALLIFFWEYLTWEFLVPTPPPLPDQVVDPVGEVEDGEHRREDHPRHHVDPLRPLHGVGVGGQLIKKRQTYTYSPTNIFIYYF